MALVVKNLPANAGDIRDMGSIPGSGRSPGGGHSNTLQCSFLDNPMVRGAWQATVHLDKSPAGPLYFKLLLSPSIQFNLEPGTDIKWSRAEARVPRRTAGQAGVHSIPAKGLRISPLSPPSESLTPGKEMPSIPPGPRQSWLENRLHGDTEVGANEYFGDDVLGIFKTPRKTLVFPGLKNSLYTPGIPDDPRTP